MYQPRADHAGFAVVQRAHRVKHMGQVHNLDLHPLNHLFVGGIGVPCLKDNPLTDAIERQLAHIFELGRDSHIDDFSLSGFDNPLHIIQIDGR